MLSKEESIVMFHFLKEGLSKTVIAEKLGINRRTVHRHIKEGKDKSGYRPRPPAPSLLDPYRDYLNARLKSYPELSATRLLAEIKELGYRGKYTVLKDYIRGLRPPTVIPLELRFEVSPGQQAQADFATFKTSFGIVHALLVVLSWSRYLWVRFYCHGDQLTVLSGLHRSFLAFGGVPHTLLFDRMKTVVARAGPDGEAIFNDEIMRFATHYGFRPKACSPHRPKTKGRVERAVAYLRDSFFYGRNFHNLEDLNRQVDMWLEATANSRIHGTTGETPVDRLNKEKSSLLPLPYVSYVPVVSLGRRISRDGYVSYNGNDYSVPEGLSSNEIQLRATLEELRLYQEDKLVATHPVLEGRGARRLAPEHRRNLRLYLRRYEEDTGGMSELIEVQHRPLVIYEEVLR